jgi:hypothetical protein
MVSPQSVTVPQGGTQIFTAQVTGTSNSGATFTVQEPNGGTITNTGVYTAPTTPGTYHVVVTSIADTSAKATATVTVPSVGISLTSTAAAVGIGQTLTITPVVTGTTNIGVTGMVVQGATGGTVVAGPGNTLIYTASNTPGMYTVTVTSAADPTQSATIQITVSQGPTGTGVVTIQ